jgi:hypothetical protein
MLSLGQGQLVGDDNLRVQATLLNLRAGRGLAGISSAINGGSKSTAKVQSACQWSQSHLGEMCISDLRPYAPVQASWTHQ